VQLKRSKRKDLYSVLGVGQDASESEIKTAYRKAALRLHPGTGTGCTASAVGICRVRPAWIACSLT
jgi:curved DNA-binding protein CbpA